MTSVTPSAPNRRRQAEQRREALRESFLWTVDRLDRRRAVEIRDADIEDYVALDWLEWAGGTLRLTVTGQNICRQLRSRIG